MPKRKRGGRGVGRPKKPASPSQTPAGTSKAGPCPNKLAAAKSLMLSIGNYNALSARLESFEKMPWPHARPTPQNLAAAGFFYDPYGVTTGLPAEMARHPAKASAWVYDDQGQPDPMDNCICPSCEISVDGWEPDDDPFEEHKKRSPRCRMAHALRRQRGGARPAQKVAAATDATAPAPVPAADDQAQDPAEHRRKRRAIKVTLRMAHRPGSHASSPIVIDDDALTPRQTGNTAIDNKADDRSNPGPATAATAAESSAAASSPSKADDVPQLSAAEAIMRHGSLEPRNVGSRNIAQQPSERPGSTTSPAHPAPGPIRGGNPSPANPGPRTAMSTVRLARATMHRRRA